MLFRSCPLVLSYILLAPLSTLSCTHSLVGVFMYVCVCPCVCVRVCVYERQSCPSTRSQHLVLISPMPTRLKSETFLHFSKSLRKQRALRDGKEESFFHQNPHRYPILLPPKKTRYLKCFFSLFTEQRKGLLCFILQREKRKRVGGSDE